MSVIVSLTTISQRIEITYYTILSILHQKHRPDRIILNISHEPYLLDKGINEEEIEELQGLDKSLKINWVKNTGPYRKLIPAISDLEENDMLITIDDDVIYNQYFVKNLVESSEQHPDCIICTKARVIKKNFLNSYQNYLHWNRIDRSCISSQLLPIGCGGILYKKKFFQESLIDENFLHLAPTADDLWFRINSLINKINVYIDYENGISNYYLEDSNKLYEINVKKKASSRQLLLKILEKIKKTLGYFGLFKTRNDIYWKNIIGYYKKKYNQEIHIAPYTNSNSFIDRS